MPALNLTVSLCEVLEVRDGPLTDAEIFALLCQAAEALQDLFLTGQASSEFGPAFVINPDALYLTGEGQVRFGHAGALQQYANYMAPETDEGFVMTATSIEQIYVFALGKSLIYSSEYGLRPEEPVRISDSLESLLRSMTHRSSSQRLPLVKVMDACAVHKERHQRGQKSSSRVATDLYNSVLGTEAQVDKQQTATHARVTSRQKSNVSQQELSLDRSRRKRNRSDGSRGNKSRRSPEQKYRSRSRSRTRSRSRSHSRKGRDRDADSPDSGYHRNTPLLGGAHSRATDEGGGRGHQPGSSSRQHRAATGGSRSGGHLLDITNNSNGSSRNGHSSSQKKSSSSSSGHSRPSNRKQPANSHRTIENPAFKKYLRLKERQRKLRALRMDNTDEDASSELSDIVVDQLSDSRSMMSLASYNVGIYHPDVHLKYGSNSALRINHDSDKDSIISSEASTVVSDHNVLRASGDMSDPYIEWLHQLTSARPPNPNLTAGTAHSPTHTHPPRPTRSKKHKKPPSPKMQKKEFYGPEFVHRSSKPIKRVPIALQGESRKNPGRVCRVVVVLLSGQKLELMVDPSTTGQQLFEAVMTEIEQPEFYFFGLTYVNDNEHFFIGSETKLHKVAPDNWKESWKPTIPPITFTVYLRVKFYVETLAALKHDVTRHQLYLQLRRDILEERCYCNEDMALSLAALALQAEYGPYTRDTMGRNYFIPEHYFSGRTLKRLGTGYIRDHAPESHAECAKLSDVEAETEFIRLVQELLPEYGIHFHKLLKKKSDPGNVTWVGVNVNQLILADTSGDQRVVAHEYPWAAIQKISFNRRRFSVQPRPEFGQLKPVKMNFYTTTYKKGQYLLKFCTAQHSFQLKMKTRGGSTEQVPEFGSADHGSIGDAEDMDSGNSEDDHTVTEEQASQQDVEDVDMESGGFHATDHIPQKQPAAYRNPPPYHPDTSVSMIELPTALRDSNSVPVRYAPRSATMADIDVTVEDADDIPSVESIPAFAASQAYVIDTSSRSADQTLFPHSGNETISNTLNQRCKDELLSPDNSTCEPEIFQVDLQKTDEYGIGITIVGGDSPGRHAYGVFVKSVLLNGPAYLDGRIKPGDRILAIDGRSLQGLPHHDAVTLIKEAPRDSVKLLISQVKPPRSIKKPDSDSIHGEKLHHMTNLASDNRETREASPASARADQGSPIPVTVHSASVHSHHSVEEEFIEKEETPITKNEQKKLATEPSIPGSVSVCEGEDERSYGKVDVHSTLSRGDTPHSDWEVSETVDGEEKGNTDDDESYTDSDFDEVVAQVIDNQHVPSAPTVPSRPDQEPVEAEVFEVFLDKQGGSFGLNVTGGVNTSVRHGGIYVKSVIPDSAADLDGTIQKGDRILEVDGRSLEGFTHKQAVQTLCSAPPFCKLMVARETRPDQSSPSSHASTEHSEVTQAEVTQPEVLRPQAIRPEVIRPEVKRQELSQPKIIQPDVIQSEVIQPEVIEVIQAEVKTNVDRMPQVEDRLAAMAANMDDVYAKFVNDDNTYSVDLKKGGYGLGLSILGGRGHLGPAADDNVVRIKRVFPIGPAADTPIRSGDVILAVNDTSVKGLSQTEAMSVLRGAGKLVTLQMCHPDPEQLPPLLHLESDESLQITPTSSTSHASVSEDSDSDSEDEVTPRREALITPPTGFAPSPYPQDSEGHIIPKVASPPPPLPISPPPTMLMSSEVEMHPHEDPQRDPHEGAPRPHSLTGWAGHEEEEEDSEEGEEFEVEVGVAELMDSCRSEMVFIQNVKKQQPGSLNASLVVREDSVQTVNSRDVTPVAYVSRDTTPCVDVAGDATPVNEIDDESKATVDDSTDGKERSESAMSGLDTSHGVTLSTVDSVGTSLTRQSQVEESSDSESDSTLSFTRTDKTTSLLENRLGSIDEDQDLTGSFGTSLQGTYNAEPSESGLHEHDESDGFDIEEDSVINDSVNDGRDDDESGYSPDFVNKDRDKGEYNYTKEEKYENKDEDYDYEDEDNEDDDDDDDDDDEVSDNLRRLEEKYKEQEEDEEVEEEAEEEEVESDEEEEQVVDDRGDDEVTESEGSTLDPASGRETLSRTAEHWPLQPGELEVTLTKPEGKGLGFTVAGGASTTGGCYIKAVLQDPALSDGTLRPGDKLIMVNNMDVRSLSHFEAVTVLREASDTVALRVYRAGRDVGDAGQADVAQTSHTPGSLTQQAAHTHLEQGTFEIPRRSSVSDEHVSESESDESSTDDDEGVPSRSGEDKDSTAGADGEHPIQDLIQSLEKSALETRPPRSDNKVENYWRDKSQKEAGDVVNLSPKSPEPSVYQIDLQKPESSGLGISLVTAETRNQTGVFVKTVAPGGVAHRDGRLHVGDKILQINGESLIGMNHNKAATILRNSHGRLSLTVSRNKRRSPFWLEEEGEEAPGYQGAESDGDEGDDGNEVSELEIDVTSSLSITQYVPTDIEDDGVEDLMAEAVRVLNEANHELDDENVGADNKEVEPSLSDLSAPFSKENGADKSESECDDDDDSSSNEGNNKTGKSQQASAHKYLMASETIEYAPDEIEQDNEDSAATEQGEDDEIYSDECGSESDIIEDLSDGEDSEEERAVSSSTVIDDSDGRCWCDSLRKLDLTLPDLPGEVTSKWLGRLPVATVAREMWGTVPGLLAQLQEKIEVDDPQAEFKQLRSVMLTDECVAAHHPNNKPKNRFRNVLPYDCNRVLLSSPSSDQDRPSSAPHSDYINASHIQYPVADSICDYIACQGPLPDTTAAFWTMVWERGVSVVVMLTLDVEKMKVKCHRYWPETAETPIHVAEGRFRLSLLYLNTLADFDIRNILIEDLETGDSRSIYHLNYTTWPDHGTPLSALPLLQCMRLSHQYRDGGPIIVHCSAGIGRSGTFITIDIALAHLERGEQFNILDIVKELRRQRQGMIQTRDQYLFCYTACVEALLANSS